MWAKDLAREDLGVSHYHSVATNNGEVYLAGTLYGGQHDFNPDPEEEEIMVTTGTEDAFIEVLNGRRWVC